MIDIEESEKSKIIECLTRYDIVKLNSLSISEDNKNKLLTILKTRGNPNKVLKVMQSIWSLWYSFEGYT